jgi:GDP-L-fucose synthase
MNLKKNIIITGGSGLVGSAFQKIKNDYKDREFIFLTSKDADLTNYDKSKQVFKLYNPNYVIHLAAYVGGLYKNINNNVEMYEKNTIINLNVLKICHELNINKVVCCLSTCIFPDNIIYPINESQLHLGPPHNSNKGYSYAKRMLEIHCSLYNKQYNRNYICVIPTNVYGEHDNFSLSDGHVIPALIHKCFLSNINNKEFVVYGTGKPLRQFIYSIDLAKLIIIVLHL